MNFDLFNFLLPVGVSSWMTILYSAQLPLSSLAFCIKKQNKQTNNKKKTDEEIQKNLSSFSRIYPTHTLCYNLQLGLLSYLLL